LTDARAAVASLTDDRLEESLKDLIDDDLTLVSRVASDYQSTNPIERVTVSTDHDLIELVCKYSSARVDRITGHSRGALYEGSIYAQVFPDPDLDTPACHGTFQVDDSLGCIVLEHVDGYRIHHSIYPKGLVEVCADLARFHARGVRSLPSGHNVFSGSYFSRLVFEMKLLPGVAPRLRGADTNVVEALANAPRTLIHGELYPQNVLINELGSVVIDWESAGVGPGVIDLAVLTQGSWDDDLVDECEEVYWQGRGEVAAQPWARRNLAAARVFAAGQLLLHLTRKETDGVQEEIALDTIGAEASRLRG
jgi:hypothetical protein